MRMATSLLSEPREVARRVIEEIVGEGRLDLVETLFAPDLVEHQRDAAQGANGARSLFAGLRRAFPDLAVEILHLDVVGERAWVHFRARGTHTGPLGDIPPTGRAFTTEVFDLLRVVDGRVVEHWGVPDQLGMLEQLGIVAW